MNAERIRELIKKRSETDDEWAYGVEQCWNELADALLEDLPWTMDFIENECTDEEFTWIQEVWDELVQKTQSIELIKCIRRTIKKFPEEAALHHCDENLDVSIEGFLMMDDDVVEALLSRNVK